MMRRKNKIVIETNELTKEAKVSMRTRTITALILTAVVVPCLFLGGWFYFALSVLVTFCSAYELVKILKIQGKIKYFVYVACILISFAFVYWIFIKNNVTSYLNNSQISPDTFLTIGFKTISSSIILILVTAGVLFSFCFMNEEMNVGKVCYLIAMIIITSLCIQAFLYLRFSPTDLFKNAGVDVSTPFFKYFQSALLFVYVVLGTISNDIGAYFIGILFGKHKVNPRISPKKTWEGFFGGIFFSFIFSSAFALVVAGLGCPILPVLDLQNFHWLWILLLSAVLPFIANLGDFTFSAIKRNFNVKDFSNLLPGHGGILDRIDSLLFTSGFISVMLIFINNGWNFFS